MLEIPAFLRRRSRGSRGSKNILRPQGSKKTRFGAPGCPKGTVGKRPLLGSSGWPGSNCHRFPITVFTIHYVKALAGQGHKCSLNCNSSLINKQIFRSSGWPGQDVHLISLRFLWMIQYFWALSGHAQVLIGFQWNSWTFIMSDLWLPSSRFSLIFNYIRIDSLLFRSYSWPDPHVYFSTGSLMQNS